MKLRSLSILGVVIAALALGSVSGPREPNVIKEKLEIGVSRADGTREALAAVEVITKSTDSAFARKLAYARVLAGYQPSLTDRALGWLSPSVAYALITNGGETALRDCFGGTGTPTCTTVQNFKFHGAGTSAAAAAEGDTGCVAELTTQYNPDNTRATGSQTNNGANIYRTVGTVTVDASASLTEWCLMSQAATGGGTMWSRIVYSTISVASADSVQYTYDLTIE